MSRPAATSLLALTALFATACSSAGGSTGVDAGPPKPGGTLRLGISSSPDCVDPQQVGTNASLNVGRQLVDSLIRRVRRRRAAR
ncbi:hypothetical protein [Amycolatopsis coloradensis]|uniref:hypothetical protein n=1 Tax=Amycolatopsis coloradensis TaxID=76021 RepID=UPI003CC9210C